jgi:GNAT superfamily N-acetyltransferase
MTGLRDGYHAVPRGKLANVQTFLEMRAKPALRPSPDGAWRLERLRKPELARYRAAVHLVGDEYLWCYRLAMSDAELERFLLDPRVEAYLLVGDDGDAGVLELDLRVDGECELSLFGVAPPLVGTGAGRRLMNRAIEIAWSHPIERFWLHTCTLDHPSALAFYRRSGFVVFKREVEVYDDPRVLGITRRDAAPNVPIL